MEYVKDKRPIEIRIVHSETQKDRKEAVYVRYSYNGTEIHIVLVVSISCENKVISWMGNEEEIQRGSHKRY